MIIKIDEFMLLIQPRFLRSSLRFCSLHIFSRNSLFQTQENIISTAMSMSKKPTVFQKMVRYGSWGKDVCNIA